MTGVSSHSVEFDVPAPSPSGVPATARRRGPTPDWAYGLAGIATMFVVWELVVRTGAVSADSLPYPAATMQRAGELLVDATFLTEVAQTLWAWLLAMLVASAVGIPLGLTLGYFSAFYRPSSSVVHAGRSIPSSAFLPIAILLFGLGTQMKVSLAIYAIFWPILLNAMYGVRDTEPLMLATGRSMGWGRTRLLTRVVLPSAAPSIATGLRVASSTALIVVLSAELLGATSGVGTVITTYQQAQRPDFVYAGILLVGLLGMALYYGFNLVERLVVPWGQAQRESGR
ncbi:ABC transporter permease [Micromonospora sp. WMMD712]|uniref:ABC transporter permease n=1 Tax=Micromonospora sp. WMMD712 TaxID=3016096 RepID=UPI002499B791|nr:ABC transporter permease [Micromonospora sp. WMMD712]WFE57646.1 ABC transporter permease [Micromonospora sp. WMMD712]